MINANLVAGRRDS